MFALRKLFRQSRTEVLDPVGEFRRELGLDVPEPKRQRGWLVRVISAAHKWTLSDFAIDVLFAIALVSFVAMFVFAAAAASVAAFALAVISVVLADVPREKRGRALYYTYLSLLAVIAIVGSSLGHPVASSVPIAINLLVFIVNGIRLASGSRAETTSKKTAEELVTEVFERFVEKHRPDLVSERSSLNQKLSAIAQKIARAGEIRARLEGELKVSDGNRKEAVQEEIDRITLAISQLRSEQEELERTKGEMLTALQVFEAIKGDALSYVRLRSLSEEAREVLGDASVLSAQAERELEDIRQKIGQGLIRINRAVERLGLTSLGIEEAPLEALYSGAERVANATVDREVAIRRLSGV